MNLVTGIFIPLVEKDEVVIEIINYFNRQALSDFELIVIDQTKGQIKKN